MSVVIDLNKKMILKLSNSLFGRLHRACSEFLEEDSNINIKRWIEDTDQEVYGGGAVYADIADYFKNKKELLYFAEMVKKASEKEHEIFGSYEGGTEALNNFHQELLNYARELE